MTLIEIARVLAALVFVLGLIGLVAIAARRAGFSASADPGRRRRLAIVESIAIDQRRKIAIIRCDEREHLVSINASSISVIDRSINLPSIAAQTGPAEGEAAALPARNNDAAPASHTDDPGMGAPAALKRALALLKRAGASLNTARVPHGAEAATPVPAGMAADGLDLETQRQEKRA